MCLTPSCWRGHSEHDAYISRFVEDLYPNLYTIPEPYLKFEKEVPNLLSLSGLYRNIAEIGQVAGERKELEVEGSSEKNGPCPNYMQAAKETAFFAPRSCPA